MKNSNKYYISGKFIVRDLPVNTLFKNAFTRAIAYFIFSNFYKVVLVIYNLLFKKERTYKYSLCICSCFKDEAPFLKEWIDYHLLVGVEHFYLYNNNSSDNYEEVLAPYIEGGIVELIYWPHNHAQMKAVKDCYLKNRVMTHWLTHLDIDEFLCPLSVDNIQVLLEQYRKYPGIAIYWKQFGSNGIINHDYAKLVIEQYTQCWDRYSLMTKMVCNMDYDICLSQLDNPHNFKSELFHIPVPPINQFKRIILFGIHIVPNTENNIIQINHYWNKSLDLFNVKQQRGDGCFEDEEGMRRLRQQLLFSHETMCTSKDFSILRFLLPLRTSIG